MEQYVAFADGRISAAIDSLKIALAFAYRVQTDTLISGLVGISMDAIVIKEFAAHLDQLSIYDCDKVVELMKGHLAAQNPGVRILELEKEYIVKALEKRREDPSGLVDLLLLGVTPKDEAQIRDVAFIRDHLAAHPQALGSMIDAVEAQVKTAYEQAEAKLVTYAGSGPPVLRSAENTPVATLLRSVTVSPQQITDRYASAQCRKRLLAVHALIHRYRWDHGSLPASLSELHADDLVKDPFTGETMLYRRESDNYTLSSAGPYLIDEATREPTQQRAALKL
jgi:hypothetical protein